jgi:hypothetical protein
MSSYCLFLLFYSSFFIGFVSIVMIYLQDTVKIGFIDVFVSSFTIPFGVDGYLLGVGVADGH